MDSAPNINAQLSYSFKVHDKDPSIDGKLNPKIIKETWEENVYRIKKEDFWDNRTFVDLGANIGAVSIWVDRWNRETDKPIRIYAVEPQSENRSLFEENWYSNPTNSAPTLYSKAIWWSTGSVQITAQGANSNIFGRGEEVSAITISELMNDIERDTGRRTIDVLKCDIEGAEFDLFINTPLDVLANIHYIVLETDATDTDKWGRVVQKLSELFHVETLGAASRGTYIYARRY